MISSRPAARTTSTTPDGAVVLGAAVRAAQGAGRPLVALESSVLAQGLPIPQNEEADARMRAAIRARGAEPAITAVVRGAVTAGLDGDELARFLRREGVRKVSARDLPVAIAQRADGATTVAASLAICRAAALPVFATGGIGGVHREPTFDESADLVELARSPVICVCAGAKSILDIRATLERLETLGVTVVGYRTEAFPGFFTESTGERVPARVDDPSAVAAIHHAARALGRPGATLVVQPPPTQHALAADEVERAIDRALADARMRGVRGAAVTPFLLAALVEATGGRSLAANLALLEANAALAADIAVALARPD